MGKQDFDGGELSKDNISTCYLVMGIPCPQTTENPIVGNGQNDTSQKVFEYSPQ